GAQSLRPQMRRCCTAKQSDPLLHCLTAGCRWGHSKSRHAALRRALRGCNHSSDANLMKSPAAQVAGRRLLVVAIIVLAAVLRVYRLADLPAGLFCDEAALGFSAHCIAHGGIDENGNRFPLFFWSLGASYKNPVYIYAAAIPVGLLGLSE